MLDQLPRIERQFVHARASRSSVRAPPRNRSAARPRSPWSWRRGARSSPARCRCRPCIRPAGTRHRSCAAARAGAAAGRCAPPCWPGSAARRWRDPARRSRDRAPRRSRSSPRSRQRMVARDHEHEAVAAERIGLERAGIDRAGNDAEIGDALGNQTDDLVAQALFQIDADIGMRGKKRTERFRQELGQRIGVRQAPGSGRRGRRHRRRDPRAAVRPGAGWCAHAAAGCGRPGSA